MVPREPLFRKRVNADYNLVTRFSQRRSSLHTHTQPPLGLEQLTKSSGVTDPQMWRSGHNTLRRARCSPPSTCPHTASYFSRELPRTQSTSTQNQGPLNTEAEVPIPPETVRSVGILAASQFVNNLGFGCVIPVLPLFATELGLGASGVGLILSTSAAARLVCNIPFGRLSDRVGRKPLMIAGQLLTAAASFGTAAVSTLPSLLACRLLLGSGSSCAMAGSQACLADLTASIPQHRGKIVTPRI